jgi:hypothetical protein
MLAPNRLVLFSDFSNFRKGSRLLKNIQEELLRAEKFNFQIGCVVAI